MDIKDNKKLLTVGILSLILMISLIVQVTAADFDNVKEFNPDKPAKGEIKIKDHYGLFNETLATHTIIENTDECLIDCYTIGHTELLEGRELFDSFKTINKHGKEKKLKKFDMFILKNRTELIVNKVYEEICEDKNLNGTITEVCVNNQTGIEYDTKTIGYWDKYDWGYLPPHNYTWKIEAEKLPTENIDWVLTSFGEELTEWAWWNDSWKNKRNINITGGAATLYNFSVYLEVNLTGSMETDQADIRFLDSNETIEYEFEVSYSNASNFGVWILFPVLETGTNPIYMYYNNSAASSTYDAAAVYSAMNALAAWNFDDGQEYNNSQDSTGNGNTLNADLESGSVDYSNSSALFGTSFKGSGDFQLNYPNTTDLDIGNNGTIIMWMYYKNPTADYYTIARSYASGDYGSFALWGWTSNNIQFTLYEGGTQHISTTQLVDETWYHMAFDLRSSTASIYLNGGLNVSAASGTKAIDLQAGTSADERVLLGYNSDSSGRNVLSPVDRILILDDSKNANWIERDYQNANSSKILWGIEETNEAALSITLQNPLNNTVMTNETYYPNVTFQCTANCTDGIQNITLYLDNVLQTTQFFNDTNATLIYNISLPSNAEYNWTCQASTPVTQDIAPRFNFVRNITSNFTLTSPLNNTLQTNSSVYFACNASDIRGIEDIYLILNDTVNYTIGGGPPYPTNKSLNITRTLNNGNYNYSCSVQTTEDFVNSTTYNFSVNVTSNITLNNPANGTTFNVSNVVPVNCSIDSTDYIDNLNIYVDNTLRFQVNGSNDTFLNAATNLTLGNNNYSWFCNASTPTTIIQTPSQVFEVAVPVNLTTVMNTPANASVFTAPNVSFNCSVISGMDLSNVSLYIDGSRNDTDFTTANIYEYTNSLNFADGDYTAYCEAFNNMSNGVSSSTNSFRVITEDPSIIITAPSGALAGGDFNLSLTWNVEQEPFANTEIIANCSYTYNGTVTQLSKSICINTNSTSFTFIPGISNLTMNVTNIYNNQVSNETTWIFLVAEVNQSYESISLEAVKNYYGAEFVGDNFTSASVNYDGTFYGGVLEEIASDYWIANASFFVPNISDADGFFNYNFSWILTLNNGSTVSLTNQTQQVQNIKITQQIGIGGGCHVFMGYNLYDEETQTELESNFSSEIATTVKIYSQDRSILAANTSVNITTKTVGYCTSRNLTSTSYKQPSYSLDFSTRYEAANYSVEFFNQVNTSLNKTSFTNVSNFQNLTLYLLNKTSNTDFQVTFIGSDTQPLEGAVVNLNRKFQELPTTLTVEAPLTDNNGETVLHMNRLSGQYNIVLTKNGAVVGTFTNLAPFCEDFAVGNCQFELNVEENASYVFDYSNFTEITITNIEYINSSEVISMSFITNDGNLKNVSLAITRSDIFGNRTICENSLISASGTIECSVSGIDDTSIFASVEVGGEVKSMRIIDLVDKGFGVVGYIMAFVMVLAMLLMFGESKNGILVGLLLGLVAASGLGMIQMSMIGKFTSGAYIIVLILIALWKLNRDRTN